MKKLKISLLFAVATIVLCASLLYFLFPKFHQKKTPDHLCKKGPYFCPAKIVEFSAQNIPCIEIEVEGNRTLVQVDLGSPGMDLPYEFLQKIEKKLIKRKKFSGLRGKKYESNVYELPKISIGSVSLFSVKIAETNSEFEKDTTLCGEDDPYLGRLGWGAFYGINVLIDCQNSLLAFCDSLDTLKNKGYPTQDFIEVPFVLDRGFIEFESMTEKGKLRCILDTGATKCLLNKDLDANCNDHMVIDIMDDEKYRQLNPDNKDLMVFNSGDSYPISIFEIGKKNFGPISFQRIKTPFQMDAIIGMDFIDSNLIYIDFLNQKIYIKPYEAIYHETSGGSEHKIASGLPLE